MNIETTQSFDRAFASLPELLRKKSRKVIEAFLCAVGSRRFPKGLRVHKCGPFISLSVDMNYRIFVFPVYGGVRFVFIGTHEDANRYLRK